MHAETFMPGQDDVEWFRERERNKLATTDISFQSQQRNENITLCAKPLIILRN